MSGAYERLLDRLRDDGRRVTESRAGQAVAQCPGHDDSSPSLSVRRIEGSVLVHCFAGCSTETVMAALGWKMVGLYDEPQGVTYPYTDRDGTVTRLVHRSPDKNFRQTGDTASKPGLYRLPAVTAAVAKGRKVYVVEGEKDVHALETEGVVATTAPMGASSWSRADVSPLKGADVIVVPDDDEAGRRWADDVARSLDGVARSVEYRQARVGKDAADHIAAGHTLDELIPATLEPQPTLHDKLVHDELRRLRVNAEARQRFAEEHRGPLAPFDAGTLADVLARPRPPASRVEGLIPWQAGTLLTAQRKTGKTTLVLNLARSLLTGQDFLGRFGVKPVSGDVALLNFEVSAGQLAQWADEVGVDPARLYLVNLRGRRNPLGDPEDRGHLAGLLSARGVESVICDPFGRAYTGANQNDAGEVGAFLTALDLFARTEVGASDLVLTAHAGWNGERTRGSTALEDWADAILTLTRDDSEDGGGARYLRAIGRDVDLDEDKLLFDSETRALTLAGAGSRRTASATKRSDELKRAVLEVVERRPGSSGAEVERDLRDGGRLFRKGEERTALSRLVESAQIVVKPGPKNSKHYFPASATPATPVTPSGWVGSHPTPPYRGVAPLGSWDEPSLPASPRCRICDQPMTVVEPGQTTHPGCSESEAA